MQLVKTYISQSKVHGLGLFAGEKIKKGTITWEFNPSIDILISEEDVLGLPKITQGFIKEYGSLSKLSKKYVLSADNTRFTNHSYDPNLDTMVVDGKPEAIAIANRDINEGEELTINYKTFDKISEDSEGGYLE